MLFCLLFLVLCGSQGNPEVFRPLKSKHLVKEKMLDSQILTPTQTVKQLSFVR
jgi:hypothetical protein